MSIPIYLYALFMLYFVPGSHLFLTCGHIGIHMIYCPVCLACWLQEYRGVCLCSRLFSLLLWTISSADNLRMATLISISLVRVFRPWLHGLRCWMPFTGSMRGSSLHLVHRRWRVHGGIRKLQPQIFTYNYLLLFTRLTYLFLIRFFLHYSLITFCFLSKLLWVLPISLHT